MIRSLLNFKKALESPAVCRVCFKWPADLACSKTQTKSGKAHTCNLGLQEGGGNLLHRTAHKFVQPAPSGHPFVLGPGQGTGFKMTPKVSPCIARPAVEEGSVAKEAVSA